MADRLVGRQVWRQAGRQAGSLAAGQVGRDMGGGGRQAGKWETFARTELAHDRAHPLTTPPP